MNDEAVAAAANRPGIPAELFHLTMLRLGPGSIIQPGNWGRMLKRYHMAGSNAWVLARELIFETIRLEGFADKPSRLNGTFSFFSREAANDYRSRHDSNFLQVIHRVELVDPRATIHRGGVRALDWPEKYAPFLDPMRMAARTYWRGEGDGIFELLSASPLRVVECLE